jgi:serine protease Do
MKAKVVGADSSNDVALLKVEGTDMPFVTLGSSDALLVGDQVAAIGTPLGELTATLTVGYVSAKDREVSTDGTVIRMLQTDAAINPGNSGGPLFNMKGEVIGITTAKYSGTTNSGASLEGLGFAIPIDDVKEIVQQLREQGYVSSAYLGVYVKDSYDGIGVYVDSTEPGMCADRAGVRSGDYIIAVGEYDVHSIAELTKALRNFEPGDTTTITVFRGRQVLQLRVVLDAKPAPNG